MESGMLGAETKSCHIDYTGEKKEKDMGKETVYLNDEYRYGTAKLDGQTPRIRLNAEIGAYSFSNIPYTFVAVSLKGSTVAASQFGKLVFNRPDLKGWFTEEVIVDMHLTDERAVIQQDSPPTTQGVGTVTSSTGLSINENLGTLGPIPTTGVGVGVTIGTSFSASVEDFRTVNDSSNQHVVHSYQLASTSGGAFHSPSDLVDTSGAGQFQGTPLLDPPRLSISNLPLLSQVIFLVPLQVQSTVLIIEIKQKLLKVEKTFQVFTTQVDSKSLTWSHQWQQPLPLLKIKSDQDDDGL